MMCKPADEIVQYTGALPHLNAVAQRRATHSSRGKRGLSPNALEIPCVELLGLIQRLVRVRGLVGQRDGGPVVDATRVQRRGGHELRVRRPERIGPVGLEDSDGIRCVLYGVVRLPTRQAWSARALSVLAL